MRIAIQLLLLALRSADNGIISETQHQVNGSENYTKGLELHGQKQLENAILEWNGSKGSSQTAEDCNRRNPWFVWNNKTKTCHCGSDLYGAIECIFDTNKVSVLDCYCLTIEHYTTGSAQAVAGFCLFNCVNSTNFTNKMYHRAPSDCASLNRQGTLCGQCLDGYTVPAYSYTLTCIRCDRERENWGLYIVFAFLPLTVFIIITLVFRINVLSPHLNMFVFAAQLLTDPAIVRLYLYYISQEPTLKVPTQIIITLHAIWNLDFFRVNALPNVCINANSLQILALDYLVAIYPMILIAVAYITLELHRSGFKPVLYILKPFHLLFARFRRKWGMQTTIMDTFVTFFFLSTTKLFCVSFGVLAVTRIFTNDGHVHSVNLSGRDRKSLRLR